MNVHNNKNVNSSIKDPHNKSQQANPQTITPISYSEQLRISIKAQHTPIIDDKVALLNNITQDNHSLSKMFVDLFGEQAMEQELAQIGSQPIVKRHETVEARLAECITNEIIRLQQIEEDYMKYQRILERSAKPGSNEEKWKIIVLSYRQKLQKCQQNAKQQKKMKALLQKELNARMEETQRLSNMNSIRFQKINQVTNDLEQKASQANELSSIINEMELNMSTIKKDSQKLQQQLLLAERQNQNLTRELHEISQSLRIQREKSILLERQQDQEANLFETKILSSEDDDLRREIQDIKAKYKHQIQQLETKLRMCNIEKESYFTKIQQLEQIVNSKNNDQIKIETFQQASQTQQSVGNAYNTSLYDDLEGEDVPEMAEQSNLQNRESFHQESEQEFQLSINPHFADNHRIDTPREFYEEYSDRQMQKNHLSSNLDASFDEGNSLSNAPSRYMDTLEQLTSELAQAYQRINEMTQKMNTLEDQNKRLVTKTPVEKAAGKFVGGILNNFFKK